MTRDADELMDDGSDDNAAAMRKLRVTVEDLEHRSRSVSTSSLRHDVANAVGAARNALVLLGENAEPEAAARFMEIATRNVDLATQLLRGLDAPAELPPDARTADSRSRPSGNERNDLGGAGEGDDRDTLGL